MTEAEELWIKIIMEDLKHRQETKWSYFDKPETIKSCETCGAYKLYGTCSSEECAGCFESKEHDNWWDLNSVENKKE